MVELDTSKGSITVSIVSHGHGQQVTQLVMQVLKDTLVGKLVVTLNIPEDLNLPIDNRLVLIKNTTQQGFGANHNVAFNHCKTPYYCVLNPDIILREDTFAQLITCLKQNNAGVAGPLVISPTGEQDDSWRRFPTVFTLCLKAVGYDITVMKQADKNFALFPDWIAGMCMFFRSDSYRKVRGFDERLYLYYEDVDICARLWMAGEKVIASSLAQVIHNAQRASRREWRHMRWHASSMTRYFRRYWLRLPRQPRGSTIQEK